MNRSARDPNLESLASAVRESRRSRKRPVASADIGPYVAMLVVALAAGICVIVFLTARGDNRAKQVAGDQGAAGVGVTDRAGAARDLGGDVRPIHAVTSSRRAETAAAETVLVTVISATIGPVELFPVKKARPAPPTTQSKLFGRIPESDEQPKMSHALFAIRLRVQNNSASPLDYRSWNESTPLLADDAGNAYGFCQFTSDYRPKQRLQGITPLRPGESVDDLLIFERPPATARSLDLRLPGQNVGTAQPIVISISPSQITGL
jgi:hypothetical protein